MIFITGDTHGEIDYKKLLSLKEKNLSNDDYLIICGDAGICWSPRSFQYLSLIPFPRAVLVKSSSDWYFPLKNPLAKE